MLIACLAALAMVSPGPTSLRVYHIGNSVTDTINYGALKLAAKAVGRDYIFGRHMIPGAPLEWIWRHPNDGFREEPYGYYPQALGQFTWDVLTLQPFDRHLDGAEGDVTIAKQAIDMALPKSPDLKVYIYSRWPRKDDKGELDFQKAWNRAYTGGWDGTNETRAYFERVVVDLRKAYPKRSILLVPVGDVLVEVDKRAKAGKVPGIKSVNEVYVDGIHFGPTGSFIVGATFFATLFRTDPAALPSASYGWTDEPKRKAIVAAIWDVVRGHPLSGVSAK